MGIQEQKILIVEDNEHTVRLLRFALERAGYTVMSAFSGEEGLELIHTCGLPDLAIVDFHMEPGMSGAEFCKKVHAFSDMPVIMLTAVTDEQIVEKCLEDHCEDFVFKPFSPDVLITRIRRVLSRFNSFSPARTSDIPVSERLTINFPHQIANVNGKPVSLTPIETKLLYVLMRQAGKPVNTQYILRRIWPQEIAFEDRLHVHVHRLRRKIEDKSKDPCIESKRGRGYVFRMQ